MKKQRKPKLTKKAIELALRKGATGVKDLERQLDAVFQPSRNQVRYR